MVDDMCIPAPGYLHKNTKINNKRIRRIEKKLLWHDRGTARARFVQSRDRNISWHAPCRDGWGGGGGVEDGQAEGTTLFFFFFEQFLFWWKEAGTQKEKRKRNRPSRNKKKKGKLGSVFDRDWIYRRVIAVCSSTTLCVSLFFFFLDNTKTHQLCSFFVLVQEKATDVFISHEMIGW